MMCNRRIVFLAAALCGAVGLAVAQETPLPAVTTVGWIDLDDDGQHDLYRDRDGDGINDVTGKAYAHRFAWSDIDVDGLNDRYRDADGDGVNDLESTFRDRDGDGRDDNVLDLDQDDRNDVTGLAYGRDDLHGEQFGFLHEGAVWVDEDGDGFADDAQPGQAGRGRDDRFIDRDGDGLADGCWFEDGGFQHHRARTGQGGGAGGSTGGGGAGGGLSGGFGHGGGAGT